MNKEKDQLNKPSFTTCLWFNGEGREAAAYYTGIFPDSTISQTVDNPGDLPSGKKGQELTVAFSLCGQSFLALNGGPEFKINPSISFMVNCKSENEVDHFWNALSPGGTVMMPLDKYPFSKKYGWVADRFGVSWQIILSDAFPQKIIPSLLFTGDVCARAEEALKYYTELFPESKTGNIKLREENQPPDKKGTVLFEDFSLSGNWFAAMDSAHNHGFQFTPAISFVVNCKTQADVNYYWDHFTAEGRESQCGWLEDKFGVSWQIVPAGLPDLLKNPEQAKRVFPELMKMKKIDMHVLEKA